MRLKISRVIKSWKYSSLIIPNKNFYQNNSGRGRRCATQDTAPYWSEAFSEFDLTPTSVEPMFKNLTGNNYIDGAFVHTHTDPAPEGFVHTRCNVMLKKPPIGGNPILDGEEIQIEEHDLWLCLASLESHGTTPIYGGERLIFSFGGLVPIEQINKILL